MGTNYYVHIGKRSSIGNGKCEFVEALPVRSLVGYPNVEIHDEYGKEMSVEEFLRLIAVDKLEHGAAGSRFC